MQLGELGIDRIELDPKSRDDVPQVLRGLQHLYGTPELRDEVFGILASVVPEKISPDIGRPGMELWKILVLSTLRLSLNWDYDRLHEMVNQHRTIRQLLGHGWTDEQRMVQKLERVFLSRFRIVKIEHPPKAFATFYGIIA